MGRFLNTIFILFVVCWICSFTNKAIAGNAVKTDVRIIHASQGQNHIDPKLSDLAEELSTVFKYTSYRLIKEKNMGLNENQKGVVKLPDERSLVVIPTRINGENIKYQINIFKSGNQVFSTQILLKNKRSITIGGPKFKNGYLLFNISGKTL
ncbi:MAG: hypothetical protein KAI40_08635 [Desulfobacterales bacterium]|nr:hypothetical protein [Desulfobacterales bacterium]